MDNSDRWFTSEGSITNVLGKKAVQLSMLYVSINFLVNLFIVLFGFYACKDDQKLQTVYYFAYIALIIQTIAGDIEIFTRFSNWTNLLTPILVGVMFAKIKLPQIKNLQVVIYIVFAINYIFYGLIRSIGSLPYAGCGFIWDK